jgi:hypothetical protein
MAGPTGGGEAPQGDASDSAAAARPPASPAAPPAAASHAFLALLWRRYLAQLAAAPLRTKARARLWRWQ